MGDFNQPLLPVALTVTEGEVRGRETTPARKAKWSLVAAAVGNEEGGGSEGEGNAGLVVATAVGKVGEGRETSPVRKGEWGLMVVAWRWWGLVVAAWLHSLSSNSLIL